MMLCNKRFRDIHPTGYGFDSAARVVGPSEVLRDDRVADGHE